MKSSLRQQYFEAINTLQLREGATPNEIKQAYRNLSKKYHPDLFKGDTGDTFKNISAAYRFLKKHPEPPAEVYQSSASTYSNPHFESDIDRRRSRYWAKKAEEAQLKEQMYQWLFAKGRVIVFAILFLNTLLSVDFVLPKNKIESEIVQYQFITRKSSRYGNEHVYKLAFAGGYSIRIKPTNSFKFERGGKYIISESLIFKQTTSITPLENPEKSFYQSFSIFKVFGFIIPLSLLGCFFYFYGLTNNDYKLTLLLLLTMSGLIQIGLLLSI